MKISVIGLGKLGLCTAACFASRGHKVIGVEKNSNFVIALQNRYCPINESGLEILLQKSWKNLIVTTDMKKAIEGSDITLIIVPTPSMSDGRFTNEYVEAVLKNIGPILKEKHTFHVVDVVSTVMPGSCDKSFIPLLEELSGKKCGKDFGLVYNPEFIALGSVVHDFLNPDMVLIGASDQRSGEIVSRLYSSTCDSNPNIAVMSLVNAEITKLSLNCFVTMKISFINEVSLLCEKIPGGDIDAISSAIGSDSRVGEKYFKGGLGFGGPCFPRDNIAFQAFAKDLESEAKIGTQVVAVNNSVVERLSKIIKEKVPRDKKIAILGLSYKPQTHIIEESQSIILTKMLLDAGYEIKVNDPQALKSTKEELGERVECCEDVYHCLKDCYAAVLMTNWPEYTNLNWNRINISLVIDSWRILRQSCIEGVEYIALGLGTETELKESCELEFENSIITI